MWDWVQRETPLDEKPSAEFEIPLNVTLREVFDAACDAWGIDPGPDLIDHGGTREQQYARFAFVRADRDSAGVPARESYGWPSSLRVARQAGMVEVLNPLDVTYRELLASSNLGLIDGDVTRPYVDLVRPQGDAGSVLEAVRLTVEAIQAAYAEVEDAVGYAEHTIRLVRVSLPDIHRTADHAVDDAIRVGAIAASLAWLRRKLRRWRS